MDILTETYVSSPISLYGSESPISTDENNAADYFTPIREQTGYLRIVDTGYDRNGNATDLRDLIPTSDTQYQVKLMYGSTLLWIGYIKAELFTKRLFNKVTTWEFPLICPMGAISRQAFTFNNFLSTVRSVGTILYQIFSTVDVSWSYVYISNTTDNEDLTAKIDLLNFTSVEPSYSSQTGLATWNDTKKLSSVLESIARYMGWTVFTRGQNIYIMAPGERTEMRRYSFGSLSNTNPSYVVVPADYTLLQNITYKDTNHTEEYVLGRRNIVIESNVNENEDVILPDFPDAGLNYSKVNSSGVVIYTGDTTYRSLQYYLNPAAQESYAGNLYIKTIDGIAVPESPTLDDRNMSLSDTWKDGDAKYTFKLDQNVNLRTGGDESVQVANQAMLRIMTLNAIDVPQNSMICINANAKATVDPRASYTFDPQADYIRFALRIGTYWYNGTGWSTTPSVLHAYIDEHGAIATTKAMFEAHAGATGYCINMTQSLIGQMELYLLYNPQRGSVQGMGTLDRHNILLYGLSVRIVPWDPVVFPTAKGSYTQTGLASANYADDLTVSLDLCSGSNNKYGTGQLYTADGAYLEDMEFYRTDGYYVSYAPEYYLLLRYIKAYGKTRNRLHLHVSDTYGDTPDMLYYHWSNNSEYILQSAGHDWIKEKMTLTLIER